MDVSFTGTLNSVFPEKTFKSGSRMCQFWAVETLPSFRPGGKPFENKMCFDIFFKPDKGKKDPIKELAKIPLGSVVKFTWSPRGNEWKERVFNSLRVTSPITVVREASKSARQTPTPATPPDSFGSEEPSEDAPF